MLVSLVNAAPLPLPLLVPLLTSPLLKTPFSGFDGGGSSLEPLVATPNECIADEEPISGCGLLVDELLVAAEVTGTAREVDGAENWVARAEVVLSPSSSKDDDDNSTFCWLGDKRSLFLGGGDVAPPEPESDSVEEASVRNRFAVILVERRKCR